MNKKISLFLSLMLYATCLFSSQFIENFKVTTELQNKVLTSDLKKKIITGSGMEFTVYLYAVDEKKEMYEYYSCRTGELITGNSKIGSYYLYFYDHKNKKLLSYRSRVFQEFDELRFDVEGAGIFVLHNKEEKKQSDLIFISQFGDCNGNVYEAYGLVGSNFELEKYRFLNISAQNQYFGQLPQNAKSGKLVGYAPFNQRTGTQEKYELSISKRSGFIDVKQIE